MNLRPTLAAISLFVLACAEAERNGVVDPGDIPGIATDSVLPFSGLRIIRGSGTSDTIGAVRVAPLVIQVRGADSVPLAGVEVRFADVFHFDMFRRYDVGMTMCPPTERLCGTNYVERMFTAATRTTNEKGFAEVAVRYGTYAGPARILIEVPSLGLADTARFTVLPGLPVQVRVTPSDTALAIGNSLTVGAFISDRYGNVRPEKSYTVANGNSAVADLAGLTLTAKAFGSTLVVGSSTGAEWVEPGSTRVNVVPAGTLAFATDQGLFSVTYEKSGLKRWGPGGLSPSWIPGEDAIIFAPPTAVPILRIVNSAGVTTDVVIDSTQCHNPRYPGVSPDGQWIYFSCQSWKPAGTWQLYRIRRIGTGQEMLSPDDAYSDWRGDLSHDGTKLVYMSTRGGSAELWVMDIATRARTSIAVAGLSPVWSPNGQQIAFAKGFAIHVTNADGTGTKQVSPLDRFYGDMLDWSADGKYLVVSYLHGIVLFDVVTGLEIRAATAVPFAYPSVRR